MIALLKNALAQNQFTLAQSQLQKIEQYLQLIQKWNRVYNLTSITDSKEMVYLHIIDSLTVNPFLKGKQLLDVGSGAGLPGIPLAIMNPQTKWTLIDKSAKKTRFLTQVVAELSLSNVSVIHGRCEDFHPAVCFDSILSRAYGSLSLLVESTEHLLCKEGIWIAMKGKSPQNELSLLQDHFANEVHPIRIIGANVERHVVCIQKANKGDA